VNPGPRAEPRERQRDGALDPGERWSATTGWTRPADLHVERSHAMKIVVVKQSQRGGTHICPWLIDLPTESPDKK
jgi:hypothetical protein